MYNVPGPLCDTGRDPVLVASVDCVCWPTKLEAFSNELDILEIGTHCPSVFLNKRFSQQTKSSSKEMNQNCPIYAYTTEEKK